jgi:hypothetical protein
MTYNRYFVKTAAEAPTNVVVSLYNVMMGGVYLSWYVCVCVCVCVYVVSLYNVMMGGVYLSWNVACVPITNLAKKIIIRINKIDQQGSLFPKCFCFLRWRQFVTKFHDPGLFLRFLRPKFH